VKLIAASLDNIFNWKWARQVLFFFEIRSNEGRLFLGRAEKSFRSNFGQLNDLRRCFSHTSSQVELTHYPRPNHILQQQLSNSFFPEIWLREISQKQENHFFFPWFFTPFFNLKKHISARKKTLDVPKTMTINNSKWYIGFRLPMTFCWPF